MDSAQKLFSWVEGTDSAQKLFFVPNDIDYFFVPNDNLFLDSTKFA